MPRFTILPASPRWRAAGDALPDRDHQRHDFTDLTPASTSWRRCDGRRRNILPYRQRRRSPCAPGARAKSSSRATSSCWAIQPAGSARARRSLNDGWLRSGDLGYWRPHGNLVFVARKSEMFKSGGFNVYPREIEDVIEAHPAVALAWRHRRAESSSKMRSARPCRAARRCAEADEIARWCRDRLATTSVPKRFVVCDSLPMPPVGKIDKAQPLASRSPHEAARSSGLDGAMLALAAWPAPDAATADAGGRQGLTAARWTRRSPRRRAISCRSGWLMSGCRALSCVTVSRPAGWRVNWPGDWRPPTRRPQLAVRAGAGPPLRRR